MNQQYEFIDVLPYKSFNYKDQPKVTGRMEIEIEVVTPLHISSGKLAEKDEFIYKEFIKYNKRPIIPGTSIKGCVRTIAEIVSYSCVKGYEKTFSKGKKDEKNNCIICQTFGYAAGKYSQKSRVRFTDFVLQSGDIDYKNVPKLFKPSEDECLKGNVYKGYKFYLNSKEVKTGTIPIEVVTVGSKFKGQVFFENITEEQYKLLCFSLGLGEDLYFKLGYGKPCNYGTVKARCIRVDFVECDHRLNKLKNTSAKNIAMEYERNIDQNIRNNVLKLKEIYKKP